CSRIYEMFIKNKFGQPYHSSMFPIYSTSLVVEGVTNHRFTIPVSREILGIHSDFFLNLFDGNFAEKNKDFYEIKDVSALRMILFMKYLHLKEIFLKEIRSNSVGDAIEHLSMADRFRISYVLKPVLRDLMRSKPTIEEMQELMQIAARFPKESEFARGLLALSKSPSDSLLMIQSY
ncbi:hypothetical protein PENTCL1PPCAC_19413, partial [Pristionchus entomophagus]